MKSKFLSKIKKIFKVHQPEGLIELTVFFLSEHKAVELNRIEVKNECRGRGVGTLALTELLAIADDDDLIIVLSPSEKNTLRLKKWYRRNGFMFNKSKNKDFRFTHSMIRYPHGVTRSQWIKKTQ